MHKRPAMQAVLAVALTVTAAGCGSDDNDAGAQPAVAGTAVQVVDNDFKPAKLQVATGQAVTWTWSGKALHDVAFDDFKSQAQKSGTFAHTFAAPGEYSYVCRVHPGMRGTIVVTA